MGLLGKSPEEGDTGRGRRRGPGGYLETEGDMEKTVLRTRVPFSQFVKIECRGSKPHAKQKSKMWKTSFPSYVCD